jgi:hypothetical protein
MNWPANGVATRVEKACKRASEWCRLVERLEGGQDSTLTGTSVEDDVRKLRHVRNYVRNEFRNPAKFRLCSALCGLFAESPEAIEFTSLNRTMRVMEKHPDSHNRILRDQEVGGSNPLAPTNPFRKLRGLLLNFASIC